MTLPMPTRRTALTAAAGLSLMALPVARSLAQTPAATPGGKLTEAQWRKMTLMAGTYAKMTSMVAQSKATDARVKEFAGFEATEQTTVAQTLTDKMDPPPAPLDAAHQQKLAALQAMPAGKAFDAAYVTGQIEGHHELEQIQEGYLNAQPSEGNARHIAMLARWSIRQHLTMLGDIQTMMAA